jgi:putative FmdB family regulatory protein
MDSEPAPVGSASAGPRLRAELSDQRCRLPIIAGFAATKSGPTVAMPIYAYRCATCGHTKDVLQRLSDPPLAECPACGAPRFEKQVTAAGFQLKGSGWYATDFRNPAAAPPADKPAADGTGKGDAAKPAVASDSPASTAAAPAAAAPSPAGAPTAAPDAG